MPGLCHQHYKITTAHRQFTEQDASLKAFIYIYIYMCVCVLLTWNAMSRRGIVISLTIA